MPSSYTTSLRLTLPATGELTGTWGTTVNTGITELLDAAVAGTTTISSWGGAGVPYTLSNTDGAADEARRMFIVASGTPGEAKNVICPAVSKLYFFRNDTIGGFALTLKTSGGSGITVPAGQARVLYCNGTNVVEAFNAISSLTLGTALGAGSGGTGQSTYVIGDLLYATGTTALSKLGIGTNGQILTSTGTAPQWSTLSGVAVTTFSGGTTGLTPTPATSGAVTLAGTLATTNGGTGLTSFTANRVLYTSSTSAIGQSSNLTFNGTNLGVGTGLTLATGGPYFSGGNIDSSTTSLAIGGSLIGFFTGGSEQMRLTSTGLGIGTNSPAAKLHLFDSAAPEARLQIGTTTSQGAFTFYSGSTKEGGIGLTPNSAILDISAGRSVAWGGKIAFTIDTAEQMRLTSTGLGIGTSTPFSKLDSASARTTTLSSAAAFNTMPLTVTDTTAYAAGVGGGINFRAQLGTSTYSTYAAIWSARENGTLSDFRGSLILATADNANGYPTERIRLDSSGNLLLGTTASSGQAQLQVQFSSSNASAGVRVRNTSSSGTTTNSIFQLGNDSAELAGALYQGSSTYTPGGGANALHLYNILNAPLVFGTNNTERMRITATGDVGIGTNSPGARLDVSGTVAGVLAAQIVNLSSSSSAIARLRLDSLGGAWLIDNNRVDGSLTIGNGSERLRVGSTGNLLVGTTTNTNSSTVTAGGTISETVSGTQFLVASQYDVGTAANEIPINGYLGALAYEDTETPALNIGTGITTGTGTICKVNGGLAGGVYRVTLVIDLTGLNSGGTANDIIGVNGTTLPCFIAQLPTMTVLGGRMTCLETPAGGDTDIDLYSAVEGTGVEDQAITALTETLLINAGAQTTGTVTYFSADPTVNGYLYLAGQGTANATYTAGRFLIEVFGV